MASLAPPPHRIGFVHEWAREVAASWWIYLTVPVAMSVFAMNGSVDLADLEISYLVSFCATACIGVCTQGAFVVAERRAFRVPYGLLYGLLVATGVLLGTELTLLVLSTFADFDTRSMRRGMWFVGGTAAVVITTVSLAYERLRDHARAVELRAEQAKRQALQAQVDALQSRMQPHFLFNSLNTVAALIEEDPAAAVEAVERLSELLRFSIERGHEGQVSLRDELHCAREYLALEQARFGERLDAVVDVDEALLDLRVPPFSLQPLVENAVKHGVARSRQRVHVHVSGTVNAGALHLRVRDDAVADSPGRPHTAGCGTAHRTLSERLRLLYGTSASFDAAQRPTGGYEAHIEIPFELAQRGLASA